MPADDRAHWENAKMLTTEGERERERAPAEKSPMSDCRAGRKEKHCWGHPHTHTHTHTPRQPVWCKNWSRAAAHNTHTHIDTHTRTACEAYWRDGSTGELSERGKRKWTKRRREEKAEVEIDGGSDLRRKGGSHLLAVTSCCLPSVHICSPPSLSLLPPSSTFFFSFFKSFFLLFSLLSHQPDEEMSREHRAPRLPDKMTGTTTVFLFWQGRRFGLKSVLSETSLGDHNGRTTWFNILLQWFDGFLAGELAPPNNRIIVMDGHKHSFAFFFVVVFLRMRLKRAILLEGKPAWLHQTSNMWSYITVGFHLLTFDTSWPSLK